MYAIVDIETTGGYAGQHRITEVAVVHHDGNKITGKFSTLINPERDIPPFISALTGISPKMLMHAPTFEQVAEEIFGWLEGRIFVAHNAQFDYGFLKHEFDRSGFAWNPKRLCTVRLSRKILPGFKSYSLGRLAEQLGIPITERHRAGGDAGATAEIFHLLLKKDQEGIIEKSLRRNSADAVLPPNLDPVDYKNLPEAPGVYYFLDGNGQIIYVGKAINIRRRIRGHFSGTAPEWNRSNIRKDIHKITWQLTGTELIALLLEAQEIQRLWPKYNLAQKVKQDRWGIFSYQDQNGYQRFTITPYRRVGNPEYVFDSKTAAWSFMWEIIREYKLCPKLCGLEKALTDCYEYRAGNCKGACQGKEKVALYNKRVAKALKNLKKPEGNFIIKDSGRTIDEYSIIAVEDGKPAGFGFIEKNKKIRSFRHVKEIIRKFKSVAMSQALLESWMMNSNIGEIIEF
jgi:DNA polymerase-3 subunit epsilon